MSNGRWGTRSAPHVQIAPQLQQVDPITSADLQDRIEGAYYQAPTADSLLGQAKVRLEAVVAELRTKAALEAEKAKLEKMIAALEET